MNWFLNSKFNVGLKTLLYQGLLEPEFYGDLVYKFKKNVGRADFSDQFRKIICNKRIGYYINIMRQSACLVVNPATVNNFASLFKCTPVDWASDSIMTQLWPRHKAFYFSWFGPEPFVSFFFSLSLFFFYCLAHRDLTVGFLLLQRTSGVVRHPRDLQVSFATRCLCRTTGRTTIWFLTVTCSCCPYFTLVHLLC